jgi:hypothetical protein
VLSGDLKDLVQTLETIRTSIDGRGTVCNELKIKALLGNFGDVIERPSSDHGDTSCCHVSKSLGNVVFGVEEGDPVSIGSNEFERAPITVQVTTGSGDKRGMRRPSSRE